MTALFFTLTLNTMASLFIPFQIVRLSMNKNLPLLALITTTLLASTAHAEAPSTIFNQEMANVVSSGSINLDVYNPGSTQLRIGAFSGEVIGDVSNQTLLYKKKLAQTFAAYGGLGITTNTAGTSTNTMVLGAAYTNKSDSVIFNVNPVITNTAGTSTVGVNLGAFMPLDKSTSYPGKLFPGLSVNVPLSPSGNAVILLGVRWEVKSNLTVEAGLYNTGSGLQFPGLFRINLAI